MILTTGRWTLWTDGGHPFAPQNDRAPRQLALELYAPKGGMSTWLYLIVAPADDEGVPVDEAVAPKGLPGVRSQLYSTYGDPPAAQDLEATAWTVQALRDAGLRVPQGATLRMGMGGELAVLWRMAAHELDASIPPGWTAAEARAQGARGASHAPLKLVGAAWEEVGINLADLRKMARVLRAAHATPPTTAEGLQALVTQVSTTSPAALANSPLGRGTAK